MVSVEAMATSLNIPFEGFYYTAVQFLSTDIDEALLAKQFRYLAEKGEWLEANEARTFFKLY